MKIFLTIVAMLLALSALGNFWQHNNPETIIETITDTLTIYEQLPADTVISEVVKYRYRTITDSSRQDSLQAVLDSVMQELDKGEIREYTDSIRFDTGDSLVTKIKGILFEPVQYFFMPTPNTVKVVTNTTTIHRDSRDDVWFVMAPMFGVKVSAKGLYTDADLMLITRKYGFGLTFGYDWKTDVFHKGIKFARIWDVPKIKLIP